jgi:hypothetical protein
MIDSAMVKTFRELERVCKMVGVAYGKMMAEECDVAVSCQRCVWMDAF